MMEEICNHSFIKRSEMGKPFCPNITDYYGKDGRLDLSRYAEAHPAKPVGESSNWNKFLSDSARSQIRVRPEEAARPKKRKTNSG
jgi:hypothetical protein